MKSLATMGDTVAPLSLSSGYSWSQLRSNQRPLAVSDDKADYATIRADDESKEEDGGRKKGIVKLEEAFMPNLVSSFLTSFILQYSRDHRRSNLEEEEEEEEDDDDDHDVVTADTSEVIVNMKKEIDHLKRFIHQTLNDREMVIEVHRTSEAETPEISNKFDVEVVMSELESRIKMVDLEAKQEIAELKILVKSMKERESKLETELQEQVKLIMDIENRMKISMEESLQHLYHELDKSYQEQSDKKTNAGRRRIKHLKRKLLSNSKKADAKVEALRRRVTELVQNEQVMAMELERSKYELADLKMKNSRLESQEEEDMDFTTMIPNSKSIIIKHPAADSSNEKLQYSFSTSSLSSSPFNSSSTKAAEDRSNKAGKFYSKIKKMVLGKDNQNLQAESEKVSHNDIERRLCMSDSGFPSREAGTVMMKSGNAACSRRNPTVVTVPLFRC